MKNISHNKILKKIKRWKLSESLFIHEALKKDFLVVSNSIDDILYA
jgi:hypothetical protein